MVMKRNISKRLIFFSILLSFSASSVSFGAQMADYCQTPPFIGTGGAPNVLLVEDVSGSMSWPAYNSIDGGTMLYFGTCSGGTNANAQCRYATDCNSGDCEPSAANNALEGYFDPSQHYKQEAVTNIWEQYTPTTACTIQPSSYTCMRKTSCTSSLIWTGPNSCSGSRPYPCGQPPAIVSGDCGTTSGTYLNWLNMHRVDLTDWAMTGGKPATCKGSFSANKCDPELWNQSGNSSSGLIGTVCKNSLVDGDGNTFGGCVLQMDDGVTQVKVPWCRITGAGTGCTSGGLAYLFMNLLIPPRLGVMTFDGSSSTNINSQKVYIGDFLASNVNNAAFPYSNFITNINSQTPTGGTPTGPAMWDAFNYFAQSAPQYGGFAVQTSAASPPTDRWKNPLFICDGLGGNNCVQNSCARNYVMLISDGEWNYKQSSTATKIGTNTTCSTSSIANESPDPVVPAYCMHKGFQNLATSPTISTQVNGVYTIGLFMQPGSAGVKAMGNISMYGSFANSSTHLWPDSLTVFPPNSPTCTDTDGTCSGSLCAAWPASSSDWSTKVAGWPDNFFSAADAANIKQDIMNAVQDILAHATSGTAASVLASGQGSGANLVQAAYYPVRQFYNTNIAWTGTLQNLWYYIDPTFQNTSIREDDGDKILNLATVSTYKDYITNFYFDTTQQKAAAQLYSSLDTPNLGKQGSLFSTIDFEDIANLWEAGVLLWNRNPSTRTIYTPLDTSLTGGTLTLNSALTATTNQFSTSNTAALRPMLNTDDSTASTTVNNQLAANIINYVRGVDIPTPYTYTGGSTVTVGYRPRTVQIDLNNNGNVTDTSVPVNGIAMNETVPNVWKLGDIIDSTPKIASWAELNNYDTKWSDASYASFVSSATYTTRGTVYVGSNDGMLHAFNLGTLQYKWSGQNMPREVAKLSGANLGNENWAFIPKNVLPYLQYQADPDYGHIQTVDLTPFLVDASINKPAGCIGDYWKCTKDVTSWSTILIGGMKLGGASKAKDNNCATDTPNGVCAPTVVGGTSLGYSSYYALDVTDEKNPKLLWEFSNPALGFSSSGPAIVRISSRTVSGTTSGDDGSSTNGRWFVVFGSGPTGPIDQASQKFQGSSDQNLKIFVLDLSTGALVTTIDTGIQNAFAGSLLNSVFDNEPNKLMDYQDEAVYIPYVKKCASTTTYCTAGTWTDGGVLRLLTNQDMNGTDTSATGNTALNPGNWSLSTVMSGIGPVTSSVANLLEQGSSGKLRLYFATGRYYYRSSAGSDDPSAQRNLFGIVEPCFVNGGYTPACSTQRLLSELSPVDTTTAAGVSTSTGWYVNLEGPGSFIYDENNNGTTTDDVYRDYNAERDITDPVTDPISGIAYFTTFKPYNDLCSIGGKTFIWALQYDTGGAPTNLQGTALIQVSTGVIQQMNLSNSFTSMFGRRTGAMEGLPPTTQGLNLMSPPTPAQKILHERER